MENKTKNIIIGIIVIIAIAFLFRNQIGLFSSSSTDSVTRSVTSTVSPGETFPVTYTAQGSGTKWGASVLDSISGGCEFLGLETENRYVLLNDAPTVTINVVAPQNGSCTFSGNYKFGTASIKNMNNNVVTISVSENCTTGATKCIGQYQYSCSTTHRWVSQGKVTGKCGYTGANETGSAPDETSGTTLGDSWKILLIFLAVIIIVKFALDRYGKR